MTRSRGTHGASMIRRAAFRIGLGVASLTSGSAFAALVGVPAADGDPTPSGVILPPGRILDITAGGSAGYGFEGTCGCFPITRPDGSRFDAQTDLGPKLDPFAVLPSAPIGALIARIGVSGPWFFVGGAFSAPVNGGGEVFLLYNDAVGTYVDNYGAYSAAVSIAPAAEPASWALMGVGLLALLAATQAGARRRTSAT